MKERWRFFVWFGALVILAVLFVFVLSLRKVAGDADEQMYREDIITNTTPIKISTRVESWNKYNVPLDDDIQKYIAEVCKEYDVSVPLVLAIIARESGYDPNKIGDNGKSYGLMQIYASEHTDRCIRLNAYNLLNPYQNIIVGVDYLSELLSTGKGTEWSLMAYNGGQTYAGEMAAQGNVSSYAIDVMDMSDCMIDNFKVVFE